MNLQSIEDSFLLPRNEGKLKSYVSCNDCRAWSHDAERRARHLAHWMKSDMPFCVLPVCTLASVLRSMSRRCCGRITPRCHPNCKSKVVLQSLCSSCFIIKECLRSYCDLEQYFVEEELETSHWPCETCLDTLKTVKMMWKIIVENIFRIKLPRNDEECRVCASNTICGAAKNFQRVIEEQVMYVNAKLHPSCCSSRCGSPRKKCVSINEIVRCDADEEGKLSLRSSRNTYHTARSSLSRKSHSNTSCKCVSARIQTAEADCCCNIPDDELVICRSNMDCLQKRNNWHKEEINRLKKENSCLKLQLRNICNSCKWKTALYCPVKDSIILAPKPFECFMDESSDQSEDARDIDSEMIITLRNCKNDSFRHVSLLQVLHKTNDPCVNDIREDIGTCCVKEDPINILNKVQTALGAMVNREKTIATCNKQKCERSKIEATFQKLIQSKSSPSCDSLPPCPYCFRQCCYKKCEKSEIITLY